MHRSLVAITVLTCIGCHRGGTATPVTRVPACPDSLLETPYTFARAGLTLNGTLATPGCARGAVPVVIIVAGSGNTDRNANGPGINTNAYAMLASGLAGRGIASLRYDKRAVGRSVGNIGDLTALTTDDYVADVRAAADSLARDRRFSKVVLLGHSEGAGHVLQAANRGAPVAAVVMVSGMGRRLTEVLHDQFALQSDSATLARADSSVARYLRGEPTPNVPPIAQPVTLPMYRRFMQSLAAYDPVAEARRLRLPLLVLHGSTDLQITRRDAEQLALAKPDARMVWLPNVNHVLKSIATMDVQAQLATYRNPALPLAPEVVPAIARWILELK